MSSKSIQIGILTVSDTRTKKTDKSGQCLIELAQKAGHSVVDYAICRDNIYLIRAQVSHWIATNSVETIIMTGGTGFSQTDQTIVAIQPLLDREIKGFGELFRQLSFAEIGCSTLQSNSMAGIANNTLIVALPGSTGACRLGWNQILSQQLSSDFKPCNFTHLWQ